MTDTIELYSRHFEKVMQILRGRGLLLCGYGRDGRANAMTIGWGTLGSVWGIPVWSVLVRPTRYTYKCIEASQAFSVAVPPPGLDRACAICGSQSGRDVDKLAELGLEVGQGTVCRVPVLKDCPIVYECSVVHSNDMNPQLLVPEIHKSAYRDGNFHRIYWGRIDHVHLADNAAELLKE